MLRCVTDIIRNGLRNGSTLNIITCTNQILVTQRTELPRNVLFTEIMHYITNWCAPNLITVQLNIATTSVDAVANFNLWILIGCVYIEYCNYSRWRNYFIEDGKLILNAECCMHYSQRDSILNRDFFCCRATSFVMVFSLSFIKFQRFYGILRNTHEWFLKNYGIMLNFTTSQTLLKLVGRF